MASPTYLTVDKKGRANLPEEVSEALGGGPGAFVLRDRPAAGGYELVAAELLPRDQRWFYHPEMQERLRAAEQEIRSGAVRRESVADLARRLSEPGPESPKASAPRTRRRQARPTPHPKPRSKPSPKSR